MRTKSLLLPLAIAAASAASPAFAQYNDGSVLIRVGASYVEPEDDVIGVVQTFTVDDPTTGTAAAPIVENVPVDVLSTLSLDNDTTWFISMAWMAADHWGLELYHSHGADLDAYSTVSVFAEGVETNSAAGSIGDFETNTTSLYANWYPLDATCMIQPYIGVGVSYLDIDQDFLRPVFVEDVFDANGAVVGQVDRGLVNFGSSWGWTGQVGVDFNFGRDSAWQVNVSAMYVDASPEVEIGYNQQVDVPSFGASVFVPFRVREDIDIDPWIFNLGVGYKFSF